MHGIQVDPFPRASKSRFFCGADLPPVDAFSDDPFPRASESRFRGADFPPVDAFSEITSANEPCPRHFENAIRRHDVSANACLSFCLLLFTY